MTCFHWYHLTSAGLLCLFIGVRLGMYISK